MINIKSCDECIHSKVCGLKNGYNKFVEGVKNVSIDTPDGKIWYMIDCEDMIIDVGCKHYQKIQPNVKQKELL